MKIAVLNSAYLMKCEMKCKVTKHSGETRFFFGRSIGEVVLPVNIKGFSENGELINSTVK